MASLQWMSALNTIGSVLTALVLLVGLILALVAYFRKGKSKVALLGALGFLLMFLLSCCSLTWGLADRPVLRQIPTRTQQTYFTVKQIVIFLLALVNAVGLILLAVAVWLSGKKD